MKILLKKIKIILKKIITKIVSKDRKTYPITRIENIFYFENIPKILLLRHDRLGDLITSTSFIRILKEKFPNYKIDILLSKKNIQAKKSIEKYINKIFILDKRLPKYFLLLRQLNKERYDLIIDLFDNPSTTSAVVIKYANPIFALGVNKSNAKIYDYTIPMLDRMTTNIVERVCNLLIAFGINPNDNDLKLEYPVKENSVNEFRIGINLAGSNISKYWGYENNEGLISFLLTNYENVIIRIFATGEFISIAEKLKEKFPNIIISSCNSFDNFAEEVSKCKLIISPDTSIVHLCSCFQIPIIVLYIEKKDATHSPWYPYKTKYSAITTENMLSDISLEEVKLETEKYLS